MFNKAALTVMGILLILPNLAFAQDCRQRGWNSKYNVCTPQCTDYVNCVLGLNHHVGTAISWWNNPPQGYSKILNGSRNIPHINDILVWKSIGGGSGHVAVIKQVDERSIIVEDSNYSDNYQNDCNVRIRNLALIRNGDSCSINDSNIVGWITKNKTNPGQVGLGKSYKIRITNIDDKGECSVNNHKVASVNYYGDTGWVDISNKLHNGDNEIEFKVKNEKEGYTYYFGFMENGMVKWEKSCGQVGRKGCDNKLSKGNSLTKKITVKL